VCFGLFDHAFDSAHVVTLSEFETPATSGAGFQVATFFGLGPHRPRHRLSGSTEVV